MVLLLGGSYIASLNDTFRPFHGPSSGWSLFALQKVINLKMTLFCFAKSDQPEDGSLLPCQKWSTRRWLTFALQKVMNLKMVHFCLAKNDQPEDDLLLPCKKLSTWSWLTFALQKVINLKMTRGRAETCRWEKLCNNILVTKPLNKLCLAIFYRYILWFYKHNSHVSPDSHIHSFNLCYKHQISDSVWRNNSFFLRTTRNT
jgi:hypothetical protein